MDKRNTSGVVRNGAMMSALTVIFMLMSLYVPFFSVIGMFLSGLPLAVLYIKEGLKPTLCAAFVSLCILFAFTGSILGIISMFLAYGVPGIVAGVCIKKKYNLYYSVIYTGCAFLVGILAEYMIINIFMGGLDKMFAEIFESVKSSMLEIGKTLSTGENKFDEKTINQAMSLMKETIRLYLPSMLIIASLISGYLMFSFYGWMLKKLRLTRISVPSFSMLRAPRGMVRVTLILYIISIFISDKSAFRAIVLNVVYVLYAILGICGLSLIDFKLSKRISKGAVRILIYFIILLFGGFLMPIIINICVIAGFLDSSANYRKISSVFSPNNDEFEDRSGEV